MSAFVLILGVMAVVVALAIGVLLGAVLMSFGDGQLDLLRARLLAEQRIHLATQSALQAMRHAAREGRR